LGIDRILLMAARRVTWRTLERPAAAFVEEDQT
jgi:hypothetical protein